MAARGARPAKPKNAEAPIAEPVELRKVGNAKAQNPTALTIRVPGVDFERHIDELLKLAGVTSTPDARCSLENNLSMATGLALEETGHIPTKLLTQLENSIRKTQALLRGIKKYPRWDRIHFALCPVGEGTVSVETVRNMKLGATVTVPRNPPPLGSLPERVPSDGMIAGINTYRVLGRLMREVVRSKRPQARPRKEGKREIVSYASVFFRKHSTAKVTYYPSGKFAAFCRRFYQAVTGETHLDRDALQLQIRAEVEKPTFRDLNA
jgi:hypothetical protein